jgi:hypothetical protein
MEIFGWALVRGQEIRAQLENARGPRNKGGCSRLHVSLLPRLEPSPIEGSRDRRKSVLEARGA